MDEPPPPGPDSSVARTAAEPFLPPVHSTDEFERAFGESFTSTLNLASWRPGENLLDAYSRVEQEVELAIARENEYARHIRTHLFPQLAHSRHAPPEAGVHVAQTADLNQVHRGLLFAGHVEAVDGNSVMHQTLPLSITQIGVCLVTYQGSQGTWAHRLFRRDLRERLLDSMEEVFAVLERRERTGSGEPLSKLARRGIMHYAERAILRSQSQALWRIGQGSVIPFEMLSGFWASHHTTMRRSLELFEWYADYGRFLFVPASVQRKHLLTIGYALRPGEYAIVDTIETELEQLIARGHYRDESGVRSVLERFLRDTAPQMVVGAFRVSAGAPPFVFYAHVDHAHTAAHIAIADSMLQEMRGFPMLMSLAAQYCRATLGADSLLPAVESAYAAMGEPLQSLNGAEPAG